MVYKLILKGGKEETPGLLEIYKGISYDAVRQQSPIPMQPDTYRARQLRCDMSRLDRDTVSCAQLG